MEREVELMKALQTALSVLPGECSCSPSEDHLCDSCFVEDVIKRCYLYLQDRVAIVDYTEEVDKASIYPGKDQGLMGLMYAVLGLCGEAGEVANQLKKELRDNPKVVKVLNAIGYHSLQDLDVDTDSLIEEDGDTLFYVTRVGAEAGFPDIRQIMGLNVVKVREKRKQILQTREDKTNGDGQGKG